MKGLRLALASDTFHPQVNGVTRTLAGLVDEAVRRGAQVRVLTTSDPHATGLPEVTRFPSIPFWAYPQLRVAAPGARITAELRAWRVEHNDIVVANAETASQVQRTVAGTKALAVDSTTP